jgi:hypothetical protein
VAIVPDFFSGRPWRPSTNLADGSGLEPMVLLLVSMRNIINVQR